MIHLVYPFDDARTAAPWSIGNNLALWLEAAGYAVVQYDWQDTRTPCPSPSDVLIGHPSDDGFGPFDRAIKRGGFSKAIQLAPWNGTPEYTARLARWERNVSATYAICGPYWQRRLPLNWIGLDMAVNQDAYPWVHMHFAQPGKRRALYVGCTLSCKGTSYLSRLALGTSLQVHHVGPGVVSGCYSWGLRNMDGSPLWSEFDLVINCGANDANPTTTLEGLSSGLIPVCLPTCGWGEDVATHLSGDLQQDIDLLDAYNAAPCELLYSELLDKREALDKYTWDRFCRSVINGIDTQ